MVFIPKTVQAYSFYCKFIVNQLKIQFITSYHFTLSHNENHFQQSQTLKLTSGTHKKSILKRDKKHNESYQKIAKILI